MRANRAVYKVAMMCRVLGISPSGCKRPNSAAPSPAAAPSPPVHEDTDAAVVGEVAPSSSARVTSLLKHELGQRSAAGQAERILLNAVSLQD